MNKKEIARVLRFLADNLDNEMPLDEFKIKITEAGLYPKKKNVRLRVKIIEVFGWQADFAEAMNIHESLVSKIVNGGRILNPEHQKLWAKALHCEVEEIFKNAKSGMGPQTV